MILRTPRVQRLIRHVIATAVLLAGIFSVSPAAAEAKMAIIDLRRAVADTEDGLRVQAELQQLFDTRQNEYDAKEKGYTAAAAEYEKLRKKRNSNKADLGKRRAKLEKMLMNLQGTQAAYRREMQTKENQLMGPIIKRMLAMVRRIAAKNAYDMVLSKEAVPYYRADLDITDRVIQLYNAGQGAKDSKPARAPAKPKKPATKG